MSDGAIGYRHQVFNESGYVLLFPCVGSEEELLQSYPPNPYVDTADQLFPLGTKLIQAERGWWYCKNSAAAITTMGTPLQSAAAVHAEMDDNVVVGADAAIGDYEVVITSTGNIDVAPFSSKNGAAEGYIYFNDATGEGQIYKIKSHELLTTTSDSIFVLYDPLTIALTEDVSQAGIIQHPCANVLATTAVVTGIFAGVPMCTIAASYYFWAQMAGPAAIVGNALIPKGTHVVIGTTAAKVDPALNTTTELVIGYPLTPGQTTNPECLMVHLCGNW